MPPPKYRRPLQAAALGLAVILALFLSGLLSPRPAPRYTVTDLGVLPGDTHSWANAINNRGEAVGYSQGVRRRACVFQDGRVTSLSVPPGTNSSDARDINSSGDVTGSAERPAGYHAFLDSGGQIWDLGTLPGYSDRGGVGINDHGEVVGNLWNAPVRPGMPPEHAFFYSHGKITDIGVLPGSLHSTARGINSAGQIVGECYSQSGRVRYAPFLYDSRRKTMTALSMPALYRLGHANHINDHGQVIGDISAGEGITHAAFWDGGRLTDLGAPPGYFESIAQGLNNRGEAVGNCFIGANSIKGFLSMHTSANNPLRRYLDRDTEHAFVYRQGRMQDLNDLIQEEADWTLADARGINDRGQIVGRGLHHGQERGFVLTPR